MALEEPELVRAKLTLEQAQLVAAEERARLGKTAPNAQRCEGDSEREWSATRTRPRSVDLRSRREDRERSSDGRDGTGELRESCEESDWNWR
jgi:hypothetical protein